ncbi:MAG: hypothetical protein WBA77_08480 [Microcoleaceae cyanobacterium]
MIKGKSIHYPIDLECINSLRSQREQKSIGFALHSESWAFLFGSAVIEILSGLTPIHRIDPVSDVRLWLIELAQFRDRTVTKRFKQLTILNLKTQWGNWEDFVAESG